jgi:uncharacterized protein DUF3515
MPFCSPPAPPARGAITAVLTVIAVLATITAGLLLAGCGRGDAGAGVAGDGAVRLAPPHPAPPAAARCAALARRLPSRLGGQPRRTVSPASPLTAAWGNPPITLRCGVPLPAALTPTSELVAVNGVSWFAEPAGSATPSRFTEVRREAYVEVGVPARYAPAGPILVAVSNAIAPAVPVKAGGRI